MEAGAKDAITERYAADGRSIVSMQLHTQLCLLLAIATVSRSPARHFSFVTGIATGVG
jgi:hypothetical protein